MSYCTMGVVHIHVSNRLNVCTHCTALRLSILWATYSDPKDTMMVLLVFFQFQVLEMLIKYCSTPKSEHDANSTCIEVGQAGA